jgi:hypothetical protein
MSGGNSDRGSSSRAAGSAGAEEEQSSGRQKTLQVPEIAFNPLTGLDSIKAELGEPVSIDRKERENRHNPDTIDTVITCFYPGISFIIQKSGYDGREFLMAVQITGERWEIPGGISVGDSRDTLLDSFGESARVEDTRVYYERPAEPGSNVSIRYLFIFSDERIARIEISALLV